jgi:hypothetical protein
LILTGAEFERTGHRLLSESFGYLRKALVLLRQEKSVGKQANSDAISGFAAWSSLIEPYLGDPEDPGIVSNWREKIRELD